jgi:hypothetical protein
MEVFVEAKAEYERLKAEDPTLVSSCINQFEIGKPCFQKLALHLFDFHFSPVALHGFV